MDLSVAFLFRISRIWIFPTVHGIAASTLRQRREASSIAPPLLWAQGGSPGRPGVSLPTRCARRRPAAGHCGGGPGLGLHNKYVNTLHRVTGAVKAGRCGRPAAARRKHVRGPPPTPLAGPARGGGGRWRGVGARAEGGPGTAAATAAAGAGAPDGGAADTPPPPAPAEPGGGGGGVVPGGPWAMKAAAAAGDRDGATDVMVVGVDTLPRPAPSGRGGGGGGGRPAAAAGPPTRAAA